MQKEQINDLFERFESARYLLGEVECWSARELQSIFNYSEWRNFTKVVNKARESCQNAEIPVSDHFVDVNKMIDLAKGAQRQVDDIALTRYACYLIAQNGDPAKSEVAFAQTYRRPKMSKKSNDGSNWKRRKLLKRKRKPSNNKLIRDAIVRLRENEPRT